MRIVETHPNASEATLLLNELSEELESITGNSGKSSFNENDVYVPRSLFVVAYSDNDEPIGCGAIRPISEDIAEVKRVFARVKGRNVGTEVLNYLETQAKKMGYSTLWLETRLINKRAVVFYENRGYHRIPNYGKYENRTEAICFEKNLDL